VADREQAALATRDVAALNALKDVLRGLVWAEEALQTARVDHAEFVTDLLGAVEGASYVPPLPKGVAGLFVGSVAQARGLVFDAAAVLGLAEGAFPASLREGTFLRDGERSTLNKVLASDLRLGTDSEEGDLFYTAVTRPHRALLLTRPRIADNGAPWQPSPFWEEVLRCVDVRPILVSTRDRPPPRACASWPELWQAIAADLTNSESAQAASAPAARAATAWADVRRPDEGLSIRTGAGVLQARLARDESQTQHEGDLSRWSERWEHVLGPNHLWSVTQLELYGRCPYSYLVARLLRLEPRRTPVEGLDARQIGTLYHRILAELYRGVGPGADVTDLLAHLDEVAQRVLDDAPRREGFRPTAWWQRTRLSMARNLRNTVVTLEQLAPAFQFQRAEQTFGYAGSEFPSLVVQDGEDSFRLGGIVDRIDADGEGALRIVDWKSGDVSAHRSSAVERGDDLQIALYALAVEEALRLGRVAEGLYWSVAHAKPSPFTLAKFRPGQGSGTLSAQAVAVGHAWEAVRRARAGVFGPTPPRGGCPSYCPAVAHCWRYRESGR
jgi:ATP-dependent helicase/DNAse subunit B